MSPLRLEREWGETAVTQFVISKAAWQCMGKRPLSLPPTRR